MELEFCLWSKDISAWHAGRAGVEHSADPIYLDELDNFTYLGTTLPILRNAKAVWDRHPARDKIDLVYTWVDGNDPAWQARKATVSPDPVMAQANSAVRFESGSELSYSLISAWRYFGDLGHIYIVTDRQTPSIPDALADRVTIVDHTEIFDDPAHLPTFNSHAIEAYLHRIPGLRRRFLYLNDDMLFGRPTSASTFFDTTGRSLRFASSAAAIPHSCPGSVVSAADAAARNNRDILLKHFDVFAFQKFKHTPMGIDRDVMNQMEADLPEVWAATVGNALRSERDHSIIGHLYCHYTACIGQSVPGAIRYGYFDLGYHDFKSRFDAVLARDWVGLDVFCVNESIGTRHTKTNRRHMDAVFGQIYPMGPVTRQTPDQSGSNPKLITRLAPFIRRRASKAIRVIR
ncbi:hypothetical protein GZH79_05205 [Loktanella sp. SALINAS62]|nr:hypothetical protein [Loktanella sp. SALINAS62]